MDTARTEIALVFQSGNQDSKQYSQHTLRKRHPRIVFLPTYIHIIGDASLIKIKVDRTRRLRASIHFRLAKRRCVIGAAHCWCHAIGWWLTGGTARCDASPANGQGQRATDAPRGAPGSVSVTCQSGLAAIKDSDPSCRQL